MKLFDKLLKLNELRMQIKTIEKINIELIKENLNLYIENVKLKREIEQLTNGAHTERLRKEGEGDEA